MYILFPLPLRAFRLLSSLFDFNFRYLCRAFTLWLTRGPLDKRLPIRGYHSCATFFLNLAIGYQVCELIICYCYYYYDRCGEAHIDLLYFTSLAGILVFFRISRDELKEELTSLCHNGS